MAGALAVQQRASQFAALSHRISARRNTHAAHRRSFRRGCRPLLRPRRERRRQSDLLSPSGRRRRLPDPAARRVAARNADEAGSTADGPRPTGARSPRAAAAAAGPRLPAGRRDHRAARAARVRGPAAGHRGAGRHPGDVRGLCPRPPGADDSLVPRGTTADGRRRLRDIVPRRARSAVDPRSVSGRRRAVSVQRREQGRKVAEQRRTRRQRSVPDFARAVRFTRDAAW